MFPLQSFSTEMKIFSFVFSYDMPFNWMINTLGVLLLAELTGESKNVRPSASNDIALAKTLEWYKAILATFSCCLAFNLEFHLGTILTRNPYRLNQWGE